MFDILTKKLNENDINKYSLNGNYSCLRMLFFIWNTLERKLIGNETPIIEIYFNLIIKFLPYILKKCTIETIKSKNKTQEFEEKFQEFIKYCFVNYKEYNLNFIDTKMRFIIQELNNPLKYDFNEFPLLSYYSIQSKPNRDKIINEINNKNNKNNDKFLILNNFFNSKKNDITNCWKANIINLFNIGKYFASIINDKLIISIKQINKYEELLNLFLDEHEELENIFDKPIEAIQIKEYIESFDKIREELSKNINYTNECIENMINDKIKYDDDYKYLFNEIYDEKEFFNFFDFELFNSDLTEISKYKHYAFLISEYTHRDNFNSAHTIDYYKYKKYNINLSEVDEHLFSIMFFNKKISMDIDYSKNTVISKFDLFNKISGNQFFLRNYLSEYPSREELTIEQIKGINNSIDKIINSLQITECKNKLEKEIKEKIEAFKNDIEEKKKNTNEIEDKIDENSPEENKENYSFKEYEKLLEIKTIEDKIERKQYLIDILNYKYEKAISSIKVNLVIDICLTLRELLHYIYSLNLNEEMPLLYICDNLQLLKFEKEKLILLLEHDGNIKLSHLFSLYEYFESLIFPIFIYQLNDGYIEKIPIFLAKKLLYIFSNKELKQNINFTKIEFIEAIRKFISRYITSSKIMEDFVVEELDMNLFELLLKEDLWDKNIQMIKIKESFNYINNYVKFPLKVKHIFNLLELLINIDSKNYLILNNFQNDVEKEKKRKSKEKSKKLIFKKQTNEDKNAFIVEEELETNSNENEEFENQNYSDELLEDFKYIKQRKKYIYNLLKNSKIITKYIDEINNNDENSKSKYDISFIEWQNEIMNHGKILKEEYFIKKFNYFISNKKIDIKISMLKEKQEIADFGNNINNIILFDKNKIIVSYNNERIKFYLFDRKSFRKETKFIPVEIKSLIQFKELDKVKCMKELINGTLLFGTTHGNIINLEIKEIKKKNKSDFSVQKINQVKLNNSKSIIDFIEINNTLFISTDEDLNNILWENFEIKKELAKGNIKKVKDILIIFHDTIKFYDIKKDFQQLGSIDIKIINPTILNGDYMIGEDFRNNKIYLINIKERKTIKEKYYEPAQNFILEKICDEWVLKTNINNKTKLINVKFSKDENNNSYDLFANNKNSLIIESGTHLLNLYDEFFIVCKENGKINCYGCF